MRMTEDKYYLFAGEDYYPQGGMKDLIGIYITQERAEAALNNLLLNGHVDGNFTYTIDWGQIYLDEELIIDRKVKSVREGDTVTRQIEDVEKEELMIKSTAPLVAPNPFKYFTKKEFACPCGKCVNKISEDFIALLDDIRAALGAPMTVTSGYRCEAHNEAVGGRKTSAHLSGLAADISCATSAIRSKMLRLFLQNFSRVGVAKTFLHIDVDSSKPQNVTWVY